MTALLRLVPTSPAIRPSSPDRFFTEACHCRSAIAALPCVTCAAWRRHYRGLQDRRAQGRAKSVGRP